MSNEVVSVVGGGWSFSQYQHKDVPGFVIGVNDAGLRLTRPVNVIITMDRLWTEHRWDKIADRCVLDGALFYARPNALQNISGWRDTLWTRCYANNENAFVMSPKPSTLNGSNSGMVALNLAYTMKPSLVCLFGFDMTVGPQGQPYWYPPYEWAPKGATPLQRYRKWVRQFDAIARQFEAAGIEVLNVSARTTLQAFERVSIDAVSMLARVRP